MHDLITLRMTSLVDTTLLHGLTLAMRSLGSTPRMENNKQADTHQSIPTSQPDAPVRAEKHTTVEDIKTPRIRVRSGHLDIFDILDGSMLFSAHRRIGLRSTIPTSQPDAPVRAEKHTTVEDIKNIQMPGSNSDS
jgi:hypothetical protein